MSSEASMLLLPDQTNAAGFISKNINSCFFMGQCSKLLLSHLIGKAERCSTHTQDMKKTMDDTLRPPVRPGGTRLQSVSVFRILHSGSGHQLVG